jgi:hypothetical protein
MITAIERERLCIDRQQTRAMLVMESFHETI